MKLEQAARQALEALEVYGEHAKDCPQYPTYTRPQDYPKCDCGFEEAITAMREALAEPQITTPDVCGEVCARAKLCYGCNKDLEEANAKYVEQAEQEPVTKRLQEQVNYWINHYDRKSTADMELLQKDVAKFAEDAFAGGGKPIAEQEPCIECGRPTMSAESKCDDCHSMDDAAPQPVSQEPVAWRVRGYNQFKTGNPAPWRYVDGADKPTVNKPDCCDFEPLYAAPVQQAEQEPVMDYERINALREGEQNGAEDAYFFVRPENDTPSLRKMFCQGFERGFHKGLKYASHVRTKDLTDDEIMKINVDTAGIVPTCDRQFHFARAVIAADREKNK